MLQNELLFLLWIEIGIDPVEFEGDSDVKSHEIKKTATMFYSIWQHNH